MTDEQRPLPLRKRTAESLFGQRILTLDSALDDEIGTQLCSQLVMLSDDDPVADIVYRIYVDAGAAALERLAGVNGILVPGGFGERGTEGMLAAARYAREKKVPYLGICLGMQMAVIEATRSLAGVPDANSTEFTHDTKHPVVGLITEWINAEGKIELRDAASDLGGTMRLGGQVCHLASGSKAREAYGSDEIVERHRHRFEVNNQFIDELERADG